METIDIKEMKWLLLLALVYLRPIKSEKGLIIYSENADGMTIILD